jgi:predicted regulator of Ras-like GTPase activity (Roadblock/LC7/MglB family)
MSQSSVRQALEALSTKFVSVESKILDDESPSRAALDLIGFVKDQLSKIAVAMEGTAEYVISEISGEPPELRIVIVDAEKQFVIPVDSDEVEVVLKDADDDVFLRLLKQLEEMLDEAITFA